MKTLLLAFLLALASLGCQKNNMSDSTMSNTTAPAAVVTSFNARYPSASGQIEWEKEDGNRYKVKFYLGSQGWQAIFNADGSFVSESQI